MTTSDEIQAILEKIEEDDRRILYFAALLRKEAGLGPDDLVVVGGSAMEIYTEGAYVSGDIDVCGPRDTIAAVLERWGFNQPGREWARLDWKIVLDVVGPRVSGSMRLSRVVSTPYGQVRVGSIEDLIIGRLALIKFWNEPDEYPNALLLVALPKLDWEYLTHRARQENLEAELASLRETMAKNSSHEK
ncbi:MAG: hypothetical protein WBG19_02790 [Thermoplasmata archaeon]